MHLRRPSSSLRLVLFAVVAGAFCAHAAAQIVLPAEPPVRLKPLIVHDRSLNHDDDPTGLDGPDAQLIEPPFSNDLLFDDRSDDDYTADVKTEVQLATGVTPADLAAGVSRVNLRGFPTPRLRNGFTQSGVPEILSSAGGEQIQGPLTPVLGKAAPGGIQNVNTARPRGKKSNRLDFSANSNGAVSAFAETSDALVPKKVWHRVAMSWSESEGPQRFAFDRRFAASGAVVWRINRASSTMLQIDYDQRLANAAPGVPDYRPHPNAKIVGPYRPLAYFHTFGPEAGLQKRTTSVAWQYEGQLARSLSLRVGTQAFQRKVVEDRWTTGQFLLHTGKFSGTREPQHTEQPLRALTAHIEATWRFHALRAEHKLTAAVESSHVDYQREQRALDTASRNALPADVRTFDPAAPNYFRPAFSRDLYSRLITDRREVTDYTGITLSERAAFLQGRLVVSTGIRQDLVAFDLSDRRPGAARPHVTDSVSQRSQHLGANYVLIPGRILLFANTSTAFEPSTRVDARTGRIQGNETTFGYEGGAKAVFLDRRLNVTAMGFEYFNQNISRRNPLYDDPIADANQTQPQLVAAGEERFTGGSLEARGKVSEELTLNGRFTYTHAVTTQSPDLPEEVGRALTRLPRYTLSLGSRYAFNNRSRFSGLTGGATLSVISSVVSTYENSSREYLQYPSYALLNLNAGYRWKVKKLGENSLTVNVRNALDEDLLALLARPAAGRELAVSYGITF